MEANSRDRIVDHYGVDTDQQNTVAREVDDSGMIMWAMSKALRGDMALIQVHLKNDVFIKSGENRYVELDNRRYQYLSRDFSGPY